MNQAKQDEHRARANHHRAEAAKLAGTVEEALHLRAAAMWDGMAEHENHEPMEVPRPETIKP